MPAIALLAGLLALIALLIRGITRGLRHLTPEPHEEQDPMDATTARMLGGSGFDFG